MIKYIDRKETISRFIKEHNKLKELISSLPKELLLKKKTIGEWSLKDVIAHLAAWNWEAIDEVDRVLKNKATWPKRYEDKAGEDAFNKKAVELRKNMSWEEVIKDWDNSFWKQIELMKKLTEEEWKHQSGNQVWTDKTPVAVYSLFAYEYEGEGHEGGHAKQIKENLAI